MIPTTNISSIGDFIAATAGLILETNLKWWFRGQANAEWDLIPTGRRGYTPEIERNLANEFMVRARIRYSNYPAEDDYAGWVALMQHYGLPTRLLDWSRSPLIAAFFACDGYFPHQAASPDQPVDACVWAVSPGRLNEVADLDPYLYPLNANTLKPMLRSAIKGHDDLDTVVAAMAVETDLRMFVQQGAFTVHTGHKRLTDLPERSEVLRRFVIPAPALAEMALELELAGFRLGDLFPDLQNLAIELRGRTPPPAS